MAIEALSNIVKNSIGAFDSSGGSGASTTYTDVQVILSSTARKSGKITITDNTVAIGDRIDIVPMPGPYTNKGTNPDEYELMGPVTFTAIARTGEIHVYWNSPYLQKGYFNLSYKVTKAPTQPSGSLPVVYKTGKSSVSGDWDVYPEVVLTDIASGDLILAYAAKYNVINGEGGMTVRDSDDGSYTDGQTFTKVMPSSHNLGNDFLFNAFYSISNRNSATRRIKFDQDRFSSLVVVVIRNHNQVTPFDNPSIYSEMTSTGAGVKTIDNPSTTTTNALVIGFFGWYSSSVIMTLDTDWPKIEGFNDGNGQVDQIIAVGKQVTSIGNYDPYITSPDGTAISGISLIVKGS